MNKERKQKPRGIRNNNPLNIDPQKLYYDLWRPMYEGYKMAFGSRKNLAALEYSPDLHHKIHDVEFQELLAQRVADKDMSCKSTKIPRYKA